MSERGGGVGPVERAALDRARAGETARRRAHHTRLQQVAELVALGVAQRTGDRSTSRLLQDLWNLDPAEATRLIDEAADLTPRVSLHGTPLPPRLPTTAAVLAAGQIGAGHVAVIRRTMTRLDTLDGLDPTAWADAETELAHAATTLSPSGLGRAAARVLAHLDPDGVAPDERDARGDAVHLQTRRDGTLCLKAVIADAVAAEILREGLDAGSTPAGPDDQRTLAQRRAAALIEALADTRRPGGTFTDNNTNPDTDADHASNTAGDIGEDAAGSTAGNTAGAEDAGDADTDRADTDTAGDTADTDDADDPEGSTAGDTASDTAEGEVDGEVDGGAESADADEPGEAASDEAASDEAASDGALIPEPRRPQPAPSSSKPGKPGKASRGTAGRGPVRAPGRAQVVITIDHRWLHLATGHATLDSGALTDPHSARRWACDAEIIPMILGTTSEPLDVGRMTRTVTDAIRRALHIRDGGCAFPGCTRRPRRCHAHHIDHWIDGGDTALDNLVLLCAYHHQLIHHRNWRIEMINRRPWFIPPPWIDPEQRPRQGGRPPVPVPAQGGRRGNSPPQRTR